MGITVHYQGSLDDMDRVEDFEDRVLDLALALGGEARIWRSAVEDRPGQIIRGLMLDLYPGQETISLLISPEGWLINLMDIEIAEKGELAEPPWCFAKTQFGSLEGHVALVELLAALKQEFFSNLEISDEGDYWPDRDMATLAQKFSQMQAAIDGLAEGLRKYGLSAEAAEDPEILVSRIQRVATLVQRALSRPAEPAARYDGEDPGDESEGTEQQWDDAHRATRRRQERLHRAVQEHLARGEDPGEALQAAMRDIGLPDLAEELAEQADAESADDQDDFFDEADDDEDAPWLESLPDAVRDEEYLETRIDHHPLQKQSQDLMLRVYRAFELPDDQRNTQLELLQRGTGELMGGLVQAIGSEDWQPPPRLAVPELKRALRGAANAQGALFSLRAQGVASDEIFEELRGTLQSLEHGILEELRRIREEAEDSST